MTKRDRMELANAGQKIRGYLISPWEIGETNFKLVPKDIQEHLMISDESTFICLTRYIGCIQLSILVDKTIYADCVISVMGNGDSSIRGPSLICGGPGIRSLSDFELEVINQHMVMENGNMFLKGATKKPTTMDNIIRVMWDE